MPKHQNQSAAHRLAQTIVTSPLLWGILAAIGFYVAVHAGHVTHPLVLRYFAGHPIEYITTTMFFVAFAGLILKGISLLGQPKVTAESILGPVPSDGQSSKDAPKLLHRIDESAGQGRLTKRLRDAIEYVTRAPSEESVEERLQYLAEADEAESHESYALVRLIISTIPILGFLGTVIGITRAVAELAGVVGDMSFEQAINSVVSGLSVAFDTTALALGLSIILIFGMFLLRQIETRGLIAVEHEATAAIVGRFFFLNVDADPNVTAVREMSDHVLQTTGTLVHQQADVWSRSMDDAQQRWSTMAITSEKQLETALTRSLQTSLTHHAEQVEAAERAAEDRVARYWQEMMTMLDKNTETLTVQYDELRRQGEIMHQAIDATGRVIQMEDALNHNLRALRETQGLDQTVNSLAAAISVLNSKLGHTTDAPREVDLQSPPKSAHAA